MRTEWLFFQEFGSGPWFVFHWTVGFPPSKWIHNDSMYVTFGGIRNTKAWSKSRDKTFRKKHNGTIFETFK